MNINKVYDVLIVGAGPVGLALAIGLRKRGINNILVIDQTRSFRRVGQIVDLLPNGLKAIKYIDKNAYEEIKQTSLTLKQSHKQINEKKSPSKQAWNGKNLQGEIINSVSLDFDTWFNLYGEGRVSTSWYDLQTCLRNLLPSEKVQANNRCVNVESEKDFIKISCISDQTIESNPFANWEMQKSNQLKNTSTDELIKFPSELHDSEENSPIKKQDSCNKEFRAKLVVAADGINSTIRQVLYKNTHLEKFAKPQYSGVAAIGCLNVENLPDSMIEELELKYFQGDKIITLQNSSIKSDDQKLSEPRLILISKPNNTIGYLLHAPINLDVFENKTPKEFICLGIEVLKKAGFPEVFDDLLRQTNLENLIHRPYYIHPADIVDTSQSMWSQERIVLVGDAAHGMPPFAAQGANQGFEDAALITNSISNIIHNNNLDNLDVISSEFKKYEQIRRPFMQKIQEATMNNHNWCKKQWDDYSKMVYTRTFDW